MNTIKKAQWLFKLSTIIFMGVVVFGFWKLNETNKEANKIYNMPLGEYKVIAQKNLSDDKKIKVFEYKVIVNANISSEQLKSISEEIVNKAKDKTEISGIEISMYSKPDQLKDEPTIAQIVYAPGGNLSRALNNSNVNYSQFSYYVNPKTNTLKKYMDSINKRDSSNKGGSKDNNSTSNNSMKSVENTKDGYEKAIENNKKK